MKNQKFQIVIVSILVSVIALGSFLYTVNPATAQSIPGVTGGKVPVSDGEVLKAINGKVTCSSLDPSCVVQAAIPTLTKIKNGFGSIAGEACVNAVNTITSAATVAQLKNFSPSNFGLIGGDITSAGSNSAQAQALTDAQNCVDRYLNYLDGTDVTKLQTNLQDTELVSQQKITYSAVSDALGKRAQDMTAAANASWQDVLKALMVKTILNLNKNLTTTLVNSMVSKYKISDYLKYADALGTQVYSMKYINDNFDGDQEQQMMIRSLLQSDGLPAKVKTAETIATSQAQNYLGQACNVSAGQTAANQDLMSYIKCLGAYGDPQANAQYHMLVGLDQAQAAKQAGQANASAEISQSNGFAPPRNCSGSVSMQKNIDSQYDKASNDKAVADMAEAQLSAALKAGKTIQAEYDKALQAKIQAQANFDAVKDNYKNPIIDICESIATPASFVSSTIGDFIKQHIDQASNLKSDNLPFYATFLSDMASNFLTNILTGGKSASQVLKESGTSALNSALSGLSGSTSGNGTTPGGTPPIVGTGTGSTGTDAASVNIYAWDNSDSVQNIVSAFVPGKTYTIEFNFTSVKSSNPYKINIQSSTGSISTIDRALTDQEKANGYVDITYTAGNSAVSLTATMTGKDSNGADKALGNSSANYSVAGAVKGASIVLPRGPEVSFR